MQLFTGTNDPAMDILAFPGSDISGVNSSPPLVDCGQHPQLAGRIYLAAHHVVDAVNTIAPVLTKAQRDAIAANVDAVPRADYEELRELSERLTAEFKRVSSENVKLADVIDLKTEREKRRPEPTPAKVGA